MPYFSTLADTTISTGQLAAVGAGLVIANGFVTLLGNVFVKRGERGERGDRGAQGVQGREAVQSAACNKDHVEQKSLLIELARAVTSLVSTTESNERIAKIRHDERTLDASNKQQQVLEELKRRRGRGEP